MDYQTTIIVGLALLAAAVIISLLASCVSAYRRSSSDIAIVHPSQQQAKAFSKLRIQARRQPHETR